MRLQRSENPKRAAVIGGKKINKRILGQRLGGLPENRGRLRRACTLALPRRGIIAVATHLRVLPCPPVIIASIGKKTAFVNDVRERVRRRRRRVPPTAFRYCCLLGI